MGRAFSIVIIFCIVTIANFHGNYWVYSSGFICCQARFPIFQSVNAFDCLHGISVFLFAIFVILSFGVKKFNIAIILIYLPKLKIKVVYQMENGKSWLL